jgi:hypothetical protein
MDHLDYGLSDPKMVLMNDGNVFLAGQIQAPMDPPAVPRAMRWDANTKSFQSLASNMPLLVGSTLLGQVATAIDLKVSLLSMNQGVERILNATNTTTGSAPSGSKLAFKPNVPGVAHRPVRLRGVVRSTKGIDKDIAKKLEARISLVDTGGNETSSKTIPVAADSVLGGWFNSTRFDFTFETSFTDTETLPGYKIRVVLDPSRKVLPAGDPLSDTTSNFDPNWIESKCMTVNLLLVKYIMNNGTTTKELTPTELETQRGLIENRIKAMHPISYTQLNVNAYSNVEVVWDERGKGTSGADPATWNDRPGSLLDHTEPYNGGEVYGFLKLAAGVQDVSANNPGSPIQPYGADPRATSGGLKMPPNQYYLALIPEVEGHTVPTGFLGTHGTTATYQFVGSPHWNWHFAAAHPENIGWAIHELGHELGSNHTPGVGQGTDPQFPYSGDSIGVPGFDRFNPGTNLPASTIEIMWHTTPLPWVSDYNFWVWWEHQNNNAFTTFFTP